MSIVQADLAEAHVLDLFAGSGALGLEALSRGARHATLVEISARSLGTLRENIDALGAGDACTVHRGDALRFIAKLDAGQFDLAFVDPPYRLGLAEQVALRWLEQPFARRIGIEHEKAVTLPGEPDRRVYGDTVVSFFHSS